MLALSIVWHLTSCVCSINVLNILISFNKRFKKTKRNETKEEERRGKESKERKNRPSTARDAAVWKERSGALQVPDSCDNSVSLPRHLVAPAPAPVPAPTPCPCACHFLSTRLTMNSRAKGRPPRAFVRELPAAAAAC